MDKKPDMEEEFDRVTWFIKKPWWHCYCLTIFGFFFSCAALLSFAFVLTIVISLVKYLFGG